jgi:replication initiation and membrane attachment protein DnaB
MQLTEIQQFKITPEQKRTLNILHKKYKINTSQFIRDAINEKLQRDKSNIISQFTEVQEYLRNYNKCPI